MQQVIARPTRRPEVGLPRNVRLSSSDFAFLWEECLRCFYLKVKLGFPRPFGPFPKIFNAIDAGMKEYYVGKRLRLARNLPPGRIGAADQWVESAPIAVSGHSLTCTIRGKLDSAVDFDDPDYGHAIIDFKTASVPDSHVPLYGRQLHAYAWAAERPAAHQFALSPITTLGLLVFEPSSYVIRPRQGATLSGTSTWVEIPRNDMDFLAFLGGVLAVLERPEPPEPDANCGWCKYRSRSRSCSI